MVYFWSPQFLFSFIQDSDLNPNLYHIADMEGLPKIELKL